MSKVSSQSTSDHVPLAVDPSGSVPISPSSKGKSLHPEVVPTEFDHIPSDSAYSVPNLPYCSSLEGTQRTIPGAWGLLGLITDTRRDLLRSGPRTSPCYTGGERIVVGEVLAGDGNIVHWHDIDCANAQSLERHSQMLAGARGLHEGSVRYLVMDDFSQPWHGSHCVR